MNWKVVFRLRDGTEYQVNCETEREARGKVFNFSQAFEKGQANLIITPNKVFAIHPDEFRSIEIVEDES